MSKIRVRFNLGKGANYMKWKITYPDGKSRYYSPTEVQLVMTKCYLKNNKKTSDKIFAGAEKSVCAWVECENLEIRTKDFNQADVGGAQIRFNPRLAPNWLIKEISVDGLAIYRIESVDFKLFLT